MSRARGCQMAEGQVVCWGRGDLGQLGTGRALLSVGVTARTMPPDPVLLGEPATSLAAGWDHTCVVTALTARVLCWGSNGHGQLGVGHRLPVGGTPASVPPLPVALELPALQVRRGLCALLRFTTREGSVYHETGCLTTDDTRCGAHTTAGGGGRGAHVRAAAGRRGAVLGPR